MLFRRSLLVLAGCAALLMVVSDAGASPLLTVDSETFLTQGKRDFTLDVTVDSVSNLYAYELHFNITPLDGQDASTLTYIQGGSTDVILGKGGNPTGGAVQTSDGYAITVISPGTAVNGSNETVMTFTLHATDSALGRYEIGLNTKTSFLVDSSVKSIPYTVQSGIVEIIPEPAALSLLALGSLAMLKRQRKC